MRVCMATKFWTYLVFWQACAMTHLHSQWSESPRIRPDNLACISASWNGISYAHTDGKTNQPPFCALPCTSRAIPVSYTCLHIKKRRGHRDNTNDLLVWVQASSGVQMLEQEERRTISVWNCERALQKVQSRPTSKAKGPLPSEWFESSLVLLF